jgi:hypothetical protein
LCAASSHAFCVRPLYSRHGDGFPV